jgi:multiple sugar transport system permease protein
MMLILLAGLKALPIEPFEAANVDGASWWQSFTRITLPLLRPVLIIAILFRVIDSFKTFDIIFVITRAGPGNATESLNMYTFLKGLTYLRMGYASSLAVIMLVIVTFVSQLFVRRSELDAQERF